MATIIAPKQPVYVSGPMTGYPGNNTEAFEWAVKFLRGDLGFDVRSPHEVKLPLTYPQTPEEIWRSYMEEDIRLLLSCKTVVVLPGWECSRGASLEVYIAKALKMNVFPIALFTDA